MTRLLDECRLKSMQKPKDSKTVKFIDLFAGIGGFHMALSQLEGIDAQCILACDIDADARHVYEGNFGIEPKSDIRCIDEHEIKDFDLLCAGFPCQPFSKGGSQDGFNDQTRGTLFFEICRILEAKQPKFVLLENVQNLVGHDDGRTYQVICNRLIQLGYLVPDKPVILSPTDVEVPVLRPRVFIPCIKSSNCTRGRYSFPDIRRPFKAPSSLLEYFGIADDVVNSEYSITEHERTVLDAWDDFYQGLDVKVIGFPVWYDYFRYSGDYSEFPRWKAEFIRKNVDLFHRNEGHIVEWEKRHQRLNGFTPTQRKFEWQCGTACKSVYEALIQFRPSGVRVKRLDRFSTLVAMNHPQIVGPLGRRLTPDETKLLQSFPTSFRLHEQKSVALKQLGNSISIAVTKEVLRTMFQYEQKSTNPSGQPDM
jgi:DNA (cytosine-5)-methyltransferase 1